MSNVFLLWHEFERDNGAEEIKLIGVYTSAKLAAEVQNRVKGKPGFVDYPNGFSIEEPVLDLDSWVDGFFTVMLPLPDPSELNKGD